MYLSQHVYEYSFFMPLTPAFSGERSSQCRFSVEGTVSRSSQTRFTIYKQTSRSSQCRFSIYQETSRSSQCRFEIYNGSEVTN